MTLPIGSSTGFNPLKGQLLPERYATESFVRNQRIAGAALVAIGFLAGLLGPATLGASFALAAPIVFVGQILFGATLIQQAVGDAVGCSQGKIKRIAAGIFIMFGGPIGWTVGGVLWLLSNSDNRRV